MNSKTILHHELCGVRVIVFDLDGTLIDTMRYFGNIASKVINKYYGIPIPKAREMYFETSGVPFFQQLEMMFPGDMRNKKAAEEYEEKKLEFFFNEPFPGELGNILRELRKRFPQLVFVVSSNNFDNLVNDYMEKYGTKEIFDEILGFKEGFAKGKDHFDYIIRKYSVSKDEIVFIGDSWWDAKMALDNEVKFMAVTNTFPKEDWLKKFPEIPVIEDFQELIDILEEVSKCKQ